MPPKWLGVYLLLASQGYKSLCHLINRADESIWIPNLNRLLITLFMPYPLNITSGCICCVAIKISDHGICFWKGVPLFGSVPYKGFLRYNVHVNCNRLGTYWPVLVWGLVWYFNLSKWSGVWLHLASQRLQNSLSFYKYSR